MEEWKPVVGWEGVYEVSDIGRVRRIIGGVSTFAGRLCTPSPGTWNYTRVTLRHNGRYAKPMIHHLVCDAFLGPRPIHLQVNHKNGDRHDARLSNLEYVTCQQNIVHSFRVLGRKPSPPRGEKAGKAKLTADKVVSIRDEYAKGGITQAELGEKYGVTPEQIGNITRRRAWAHIP